MIFKIFFLLNLLLVIAISGEDYLYAFLKLGQITIYSVPNKTIVLTTEGYGYSTYQKPQLNSFGYSNFQIYSGVETTFEYLFDQFLIGTNEYLRFIDSQNGDYYKYGNDIIHRGNHAYYQTTTLNSTVIFGYNEQLLNDTFSHTGLKVFIREKNPKKYWCSNVNGNYDINIDVEPYFLLSYEYPYTIPTNGSCTFNVNSYSDYLRVFIYDFRLNSNVIEYIKISGELVDSLNNNGVDPNFITGYLTEDLPVTFYYKRNITIYVSDLVGQNSSRFFIKITPYNLTNFDGQNNGYCIGTNTFELAQQNSLTFGIKSYLSESFYKPNTKCLWKFDNLIDNNYRFLFDLSFESEYGCDYLQMSGFGVNSQDVWEYQGFQSRKLIYATSITNVSLKWITDGTQESIGFLGIARIQDCSCLRVPSEINYGTSPVSIYSPGYNDPNMPYCPDVECNWTFNYDIEKEYLVISVKDLDLRPASVFGKISNTIFIVNSFNRTLHSLTANDATNNGKLFFSSNGNTSIRWISDTSNVFNTHYTNGGFNFQITTKLYPITSNLRLVRLDQNQSTQYISGTVKYQIIKITGDGSQIKIIPQKNFLKSDTLIDVFGDSISPNNLIDSTYFFTSDAYSENPKGLIANHNVVYIRIYQASDDFDIVDYDFYISSVYYNDSRNPIYQHIFSNQTTYVDVFKLMYLNIFNVTRATTNGLLISTNGSQLNIYGEKNNLLSIDGVYPKYYYGNTISLSVNKNTSQLVELTPVQLPLLLEYRFYDNSNMSNIIYSRDYLTSQPEVKTNMKFTFMKGPQFFTLYIYDFRGSGKIDIFVYYEREVYSTKTIANDSNDAFMFCGSEIELNYQSNIANFSVLPNEASGFRGAYILDRWKLLFTGTDIIELKKNIVTDNERT
uniref:CUB domain-containing protein n=1 Tax=Strongyloides venezuelensis TaxID=75913 RepID=A0A0K0G4T5_STRVS